MAGNKYWKLVKVLWRGNLAGKVEKEIFGYSNGIYEKKAESAKKRRRQTRKVFFQPQSKIGSIIVNAFFSFFAWKLTTFFIILVRNFLFSFIFDKRIEFVQSK